MLGIIVGDIVESRFIFKKDRESNFKLFNEDCTFTCNTIMAFVISNAIIQTNKMLGNENKGSEYYSLFETTFNKYLSETRMKYPKFSMNLESSDMCDIKNQGAKWISPVSYTANSEDEVKNLIMIITSVLKSNKETIKGVEAVAIAIYLAKNGFSKKEIMKEINDNYYPLDFERLKVIGDPITLAFKAFQDSNSFEDAIRNAVVLGSEEISIAPITTAIAEPFYDIPQEIKDTALSYLNSNLIQLYKNWSNRDIL